MTGQRFGSWTALHHVSRETWHCRCDCGYEADVNGYTLRRGTSTRCNFCANKSVAAQRVLREDITYNALHSRLRRVRGRARDHVCAECGAQANGWAYQGGDPDERMAEVSWHGRAFEAPFTTNLDAYSPMCNGCHSRKDRWGTLSRSA